MAQPKFKVDDIVSDCDIKGEFIIREVGTSNSIFYGGTFHDYWVESLSNEMPNWMHCYEGELTLIRKGEQHE